MSNPEFGCGVRRSGVWVISQIQWQLPRPQIHLSGEIFMKMQSVFLREVGNIQAERQKDRQTPGK